MKRFLRHRIALFLILVYALGTAAPLAQALSFLSHGKRDVCAGDCRLCGCAPARSASRTCCCWRGKDKAEVTLPQQTRTPDCCNAKAERNALPVCSAASCGLQDDPLTGGESDPSLLPLPPRHPAFAFKVWDFPSPPRIRPPLPYRDPPDHPPENS